MSNKKGRPSQLKECLIKAENYASRQWEQVGDTVPSIIGLSLYLGVNRQSLYRYAEQSEEFSDTLEKIKAIQETKLINKGLSGDFNSNIVKLMLANHGYTDKQYIDHTSKGEAINKPRIIKLVGA